MKTEDESLDDVVEVDEDEFLEVLLRKMNKYLNAYHKVADYLEQYKFDKQRYIIRYYYNKKTGEYYYVRKKKEKIGFKV